MKSSFATTALITGVLCAALAAPGPAWSAAQPFTTDFRLEDCTFSAEDRNAYFSLEPGDRLVLEGEEDGESIVLEITVLNATRAVTFTTARGKRLRVVTRVVEERESVDGELFEISRNYYARCRQTGEIYYFGEDVDFFEDGEIVDHAGAWLAGRGGAQPGLIMPATFLLGARYFQEVAPGVALDRAEHTAMGLTVSVPAGTFRDCVEVLETTPLEPGQGIKRYCPGIGLVEDASAGLELVDFELDEEDD